MILEKLLRNVQEHNFIITSISRYIFLTLEWHESIQDFTITAVCQEIVLWWKSYA